MATINSRGDFTRVLRSSNLKGNKNAVILIDVKSRGPLKRRRVVEKDAVNGTEEKADGAEDEGSPGKKPKLQRAEDAGDGQENGDKNDTVEMDTADHTDTDEHTDQDHDQDHDQDQDQEMSSEDESESCNVFEKKKPLIEEKSVVRTVRTGSMEMEERTTVLSTHNIQPKPATKVIGGQNMTSSREHSSASTASGHHRPPENRKDHLTTRSSIGQYHDDLKEKTRGVSGLQIRRYPCQVQTLRIPQTNFVAAKKEEKKHSKKGCIWYMCRFLLWAVFLLALGLVIYRHLYPFIIPSQITPLVSIKFEAQLDAVKTLFPNQRKELWKRTAIHLGRHLNLTDPSEPVSMILTAGRMAEKTLGCLAKRIATAYSPAINKSVVEVDGINKAVQESEQVKFYIDSKLTEAFDDGKRAAVIHRFEELPPGSTLIFYRYCDHENAAYKKVFIGFTVVLPVDNLESSLSLSAVEEQLQEYVKGRFVSSDKTGKFNQMDVDKLSGLWSRISHLILPVTAEQSIEQNGCGDS